MKKAISGIVLGSPKPIERGEKIKKHRIAGHKKKASKYIIDKKFRRGGRLYIIGGGGGEQEEEDDQNEL